MSYFDLAQYKYGTRQIFIFVMYQKLCYGSFHPIMILYCYFFVIG